MGSLPILRRAGWLRSGREPLLRRYVDETEDGGTFESEICGLRLGGGLQRFENKGSRCGISLWHCWELSR